jgi:hypothetical protein
MAGELYCKKREATGSAGVLDSAGAPSAFPQYFLQEENS